SGSGTVDLATTVDVTLESTNVVAESDQHGPLGHGLCALLIGRSSPSRQGIFIVPGLIEGVIKIMLYTISPPFSFPAGTKIAQLMPFESQVPKASNRIQGQGGFGSTSMPNILGALEIQKGKPEEIVTIRNPCGQTVQLSMLVDTGADVTII
ncbi:hypothetical protein N307_12027, partial [Dryobates pubescens]